MINYMPAPEADVVVSSRIRLARNYSDIPFAPKMTQTHADETIQRAAGRIAGSAQANAYRLVYIARLSDAERKQLVEKHLISYDLLNYKDRAAALISTGETVSIMINEEDHLRIQSLLPGLQLEKTAELAFQADDILSGGEPFAFDARWGYLTSCPTNAGTGMRASALIHLPALTNVRKMGQIIQAVGKLGFTVRGLYGEGSEADGNLYQISNQVTMGRTEEDMIKGLLAVTDQIAEQEREERKKLFDADPDVFTDKIMRSVGIMLNARLMDGKEFMKLYSDLRLAASVGVIDAPIAGIDQLMKDMQTGSLSVLAGRALNDRDKMILRANELRSRLPEILNSDQ
ncbi:MAG: protein arginine kinase [Clostridia bacterium]|nr:protein arginine kinase [Clostridia bacterium]MBQ4156857.1 protein arginine kinase [Clostridia bacterium]